MISLPRSSRLFLAPFGPVRRGAMKRLRSPRAIDFVPTIPATGTHFGHAPTAKVHPAHDAGQASQIPDLPQPSCGEPSDVEQKPVGSSYWGLIPRIPMSKESKMRTAGDKVSEPSRWNRLDQTCGQSVEQDALDHTHETITSHSDSISDTSEQKNTTWAADNNNNNNNNDETMPLRPSKKKKKKKKKSARFLSEKREPKRTAQWLRELLKIPELYSLSWTKFQGRYSSVHLEAPVDLRMM